MHLRFKGAYHGQANDSAGAVRLSFLSGWAGRADRRDSERAGRFWGHAHRRREEPVLIMSSGSPFVYGPAIAQYYQSIVEYWGVENAGIFTANGKQNHSEEKRDELYRFGKSL